MVYFIVVRDLCTVYYNQDIIKIAQLPVTPSYKNMGGGWGDNENVAFEKVSRRLHNIDQSSLVVLSTPSPRFR